MKNLAACLLLVLLPASAQADGLPGTFTANLNLTSDYAFRGISLSDEGPALQGSIDWGWEPAGVYAGAWASTVDLEDASLEIDFYAGLNGVKNDFTWDLGAIYYAYPGADSDLDYDYWELALAGGYDFNLFAVSTALNFSPDYFGETGASLYPAAYLSVPLPHGFTVTGSMGYLLANADDNEIGNYADWSLGMTFDLEGLDAGIKYKDTSLEDPQDCDDGCDGRVIFNIGKTF